MNTKQNLLSEVNRTLRLRSKGTPQSRIERRRIMRAIIKDLLDLKIAPPSFKKITAEHIHHCVTHWQQKKNSDSTIKNKLSVLRALNQLGQFEMNIPANAELALSGQSKSSQKNKPPTQPDLIDTNHLDHIAKQLHHPITKLLFSLQLHFGLTLTEAIQICPKFAIDGATLTIHRRIAFNRKERFIAIFSEEQKLILERLNALLCDSPCLASLSLSSEKHIAQLYHAEISFIPNAPGLCLKQAFLHRYLKKCQAKQIDDTKIILLLSDQTGYSKKYIRYHLLNQV